MVPFGSSCLKRDSCEPVGYSRAKRAHCRGRRSRGFGTGRSWHGRKGGSWQCLCLSDSDRKLPSLARPCKRRERRAARAGISPRGNSSCCFLLHWGSCASGTSCASGKERKAAGLLNARLGEEKLPFSFFVAALGEGAALCKALLLLPSITMRGGRGRGRENGSSCVEAKQRQEPVFCAAWPKQPLRWAGLAQVQTSVKFLFGGWGEHLSFVEAWERLSFPNSFTI